ncbi:hypothetical protein [uncultured Clostridium sp.]|jgi:hypothetical protein|uniref:hypothetical protein n=1 Tax=uncultured Clostridium sp. TaxID=59620 RepID=UPI00260C19F0|nr:hypothetical protein [uncultured Clostridium sp.]
MFLSGKIIENNLVYNNKFNNEEVSIDVSNLKKDEVDLLTTMFDILDDGKENTILAEYKGLKEITSSFMIEVFCQEYVSNYNEAEIREKEEFIYELYDKALDSVYKGSKVYNTYIEKNK